jgi:hypothetical protein
MTTLWGDRKPGDDYAVGADEQGGYVMVGEPDRIRTPPDLGSQEFRVATMYRASCPCKAGHEVKTYTLVGTDLQVSECGGERFLWWRPRASAP